MAPERTSEAARVRAGANAPIISSWSNQSPGGKMRRVTLRQYLVEQARAGLKVTSELGLLIEVERVTSYLAQG